MQSSPALHNSIPTSNRRRNDPPRLAQECYHTYTYVYIQYIYEYREAHVFWIYVYRDIHLYLYPASILLGSTPPPNPPTRLYIIGIGRGGQALPWSLPSPQVPDSRKARAPEQRSPCAAHGIPKEQHCKVHVPSRSLWSLLRCVYLAGLRHIHHSAAAHVTMIREDWQFRSAL